MMRAETAPQHTKSIIKPNSKCLKCQNQYMGNHANTSLNVDSILRTIGMGKITTLPLEQALWGELINNLKMVT